MYLVDTSVWIDCLREGESEAAERFANVLDLGLAFGINGVIYGEVLQGAATLADFDRLKEYMGTQRFYHPQDPVISYEEAARLYFRCRRAGVTVRSTVDCVIARVASSTTFLCCTTTAISTTWAGSSPSSRPPEGELYKLIRASRADGSLSTA